MHTNKRQRLTCYIYGCFIAFFGLPPWRNSSEWNEINTLSNFNRYVGALLVAVLRELVKLHFQVLNVSSPCQGSRRFLHLPFSFEIPFTARLCGVMPRVLNYGVSPLRRKLGTTQFKRYFKIHRVGGRFSRRVLSMLRDVAQSPSRRKSHFELQPLGVVSM